MKFERRQHNGSRKQREETAAPGSFLIQMKTKTNHVELSEWLSVILFIPGHSKLKLQVFSCLSSLSSDKMRNGSKQWETLKGSSTF